MEAKEFKQRQITFKRERGEFLLGRGDPGKAWKQKLQVWLDSFPIVALDTLDCDEWKMMINRKTSNDGALMVSMEFSDRYNVKNPLLWAPSLRNLEFKQQYFSEVLSLITLKSKKNGQELK